MKHIGTQPVETKRLLFRRFYPEDAAAMFRNWASDSDVTKYMTWPAHKDISVSQYVLNTWISDYTQDNCYNWAIVLKEIDEPIGSITVVSLREDIGSVEVGYCLGKVWWGKGLMSEALNAVIDYLFREVGVNRVEAYHDVNNPASGAVMRKCGMAYEGTHRQAGRNNQGICDVSRYGILALDRNSG